MAEEIRIVLDAMGGDHAPVEHVKGGVEAVSKDSRIRLILTGHQQRIEEELRKYPEAPMDRIRIVHASEIIDTAEAPVQAVQKKKNSSLVVGLNLVKHGEADAMISSGNTGALLVGATVIIGRIKGVERAPIAVLMPTKNGRTLLLDAGANVDARPSHLRQFAKMGALYMKHVEGVANPSVGILNIGAEEEKGNSLVKETFPLLKADTQIHFTGSVEARQIPYGGTDVVVCDAFAGNIVIKMYEGTATVMLDVLKGAMTSSLTSKIGALLVKNNLKKALKVYDMNQYGGAPLLGLKSLVVKAHGSAKAVEISAAVQQCVSFYEKDVTGKIAAALEEET